MENRRVKTLRLQDWDLVKDCPSFHKSGSVRGMKKLFYGENALLVRCGSFIYNVTKKPEVYEQRAN